MTTAAAARLWSLVGCCCCCVNIPLKADVDGVAVGLCPCLEFQAPLNYPSRSAMRQFAKRSSSSLRSPPFICRLRAALYFFDFAPTMLYCWCAEMKRGNWNFCDVREPFSLSRHFVRVELNETGRWCAFLCVSFALFQKSSHNHQVLFLLLNYGDKMKYILNLAVWFH